LLLDVEVPAQARPAAPPVAVHTVAPRLRGRRQIRRKCSTCLPRRRRADRRVRLKPRAVRTGVGCPIECPGRATFAHHRACGQQEVFRPSHAGAGNLCRRAVHQTWVHATAS
jgi:hypothetical protein